MSQDTGLFSVRKPRETLGALGGGNYNSAIPQPASVKRSNSISTLREPQAPRTSQHARSVSSSRMSLAPNRPQQPNFQRSSSGTNLADFSRPSTVQRNSSSNLFANGASAHRMSYAPGAMTPANQESLSASQSLQRRSSVYSRPSSTGPMGHQSFFTQAPAQASARGDPRPWRDPNYRNKVGQDLLDYLTRNNFELEMKRSLNQKSMTSPTQKDFEAIFQWLYRRIDPAYRFMKSIDFEGPAILKQLRYPFENKVSKSQWAAVGGQNWSSFLGMLQWMMQLAQMMDQYEAGEYDAACAEAGVDVSGDRIMFRFLSGAYHDWLQVEDGDDDEDANKMLIPHVKAMAAEFERGNQKYAEEMKILEAENEVLKQQIAEAEAGAPDLAKLEKHFKILEDDKRKFEEYNTNVEGKVEKYEQRNKFLLEENERTENELREAEQEKANLQDSVDTQGITIQDIDRMNAERERLQKGLEASTVKLEEVKRKAAERENEANRSLEELERVIDKYNSLCYQIALIPSTAANAKGQDFELHLSIDSTPKFSSSQLGSSQRGASGDRLLADPSTGYHPPHVLNLDLRGYVKSQLIGLRKEINERRTLAIDADMKNHELLDSIKEAIDDKRSEVEALEHRVRAAEEEFEKTKEVTSTQKVASDAQIEKMEKELAKMRAGLDESVQLMEQREMNTNIEFEQLTLRANSLREELHTEIEKILNDVIKFKVHVQQNLENYQAFVDQEVKAELDEGEFEDEDGMANASIEEFIETCFVLLKFQLSPHLEKQNLSPLYSTTICLTDGATGVRDGSTGSRVGGQGPRLAGRGGAKAHLEAVLRGEIAKLRSNEKATNDAHESEIRDLRIRTSHQAQSITVLQRENEEFKSQNIAANAADQLLQNRYDELCKERQWYAKTLEECTAKFREGCEKALETIGMMKNKPITPALSSTAGPLRSKLLQPEDFIPISIPRIPPPLCTAPSETSALKPLGETPLDPEEQLSSAKRKRPAAQAADSSSSNPILKQQKLQQHPLHTPGTGASRSSRSRYSYNKEALSSEQKFHVQEHGDLMDIPRGQCRRSTGAASGHDRSKGVKLKGEDSQDQSDEGTVFHHDGTEEQKPCIRTRTPAPYAIDYPSPILQQEHHRGVTEAPELGARKIPFPYPGYVGSLTPDQIRTFQGAGDSLGG